MVCILRLGDLHIPLSDPPTPRPTTRLGDTREQEEHDITMKCLEMDFPNPTPPHPTPSPTLQATRVVGCRGGSRYVEGEGVSWFFGFLVHYFLGFFVQTSSFFWFLGSSSSWFLSSLVPRFLDFLVSWVVGFLVSWFLGSTVPKFRSFKVSKFQRFEDSKFQNLHLMSCLRILFPYYQHSISCFLEDIDPIFKIPKNLLVGSLGLFSPPLFKHFQHSGFPTS